MPPKKLLGWSQSCTNIKPMELKQKCVALLRQNGELSIRVFVQLNDIYLRKKKNGRPKTNGNWLSLFLGIKEYSQMKP